MLWWFVFLWLLAFSAKPWLEGHVGTSVHPPPPVSFRWITSVSPCAAYPSAYTAVTNSAQTNNLPIIYTNNIPICNVYPLCQMRREWTDAPGGGGRVTAGYKNAYSSLWLIQKFAAGILGLGLGRGPGPELAQLLAAVLSLPQPQPHCAKLLHTYNLLIIHEVLEEVRKHILQSKRVGGKLTLTGSLFSRK